MHIENFIRMVIRHFLFRYGIKGHKKNIRELISHLKAHNEYSKYSFNEYPPTIENYSFYRKLDLQWLDFYSSVYGKSDPHFISVPVYLYVESILNDRMLLSAISDKNFYNNFLPYIPTPATILRRINGFYYDAKFHKIDKKQFSTLFEKYNKLIIKPSVDSGAGHEIFVFEKKGMIFKNGEYDLNPDYMDKYNNVREINDLRFIIDDGVVLFYETKKEN